MAIINHVKLTVDQDADEQVSAIISYNITFTEAEILEGTVFLERASLKIGYGETCENSFSVSRSFVKAQDCRVLRVVRVDPNQHEIFDELELMLSGLRGVDLPTSCYAEVDLIPCRATAVSSQSNVITGGVRNSALALLY